MSVERGLPKVGRTVTSPDDAIRACEEGPAVWIHIEARKALTFVLLRDGAFAYDAHWKPGGSDPCFGRGSCLRCSKGDGVKSHFVFSIYDQTAQRTGLIDLPPHAATIILHECREMGFYRGLAFRAAKTGGVDNGRITIAPFHQILRDVDMPDGPDPEFVLYKQWGLLTDEELCPAGRGV